MELLQYQLKCLTVVRDHCKPYVEPPRHGPASQKPNKTLRGVTQWLRTFTKPMEKQKKTIHLPKNQTKCCKVTKITKKTNLFRSSAQARPLRPQKHWVYSVFWVPYSILFGFCGNGFVFWGFAWSFLGFE